MGPTPNEQSAAADDADAFGAPGTRVEIHSRFDGHWARGFEVVSHDEEGFRVLRLSDGSVLPVVFDPSEVRPERHRQGMWWF